MRRLVLLLLFLFNITLVIEACYFCFIVIIVICYIKVTCLAASENGIIACGLTSGEIFLCHNAAEVVMTYFDDNSNKKKRKKRVSPYEDNNSSSVPAIVTVLHW